MTILDVFSKRNQPAHDVFTYYLPDGLRKQVYMTLDDAMNVAGSFWVTLARSIAKEHEMLSLPEAQKFRSRHEPRNYRRDCLHYILTASETEKALDMIEQCLRLLSTSPRQDAKDAIEEINQRFLRAGVGYQFVSGQIVRVDSQLLHAEAVVPALGFLSSPGFEGPNKEFLEAHEHLRHGRFEEAIMNAGKAFESTMRVICDAKGWTYDKNKATASTLIGIVLQKQLIPTWDEEQLRNLEKCLTGLATVRNKNAGHGAGAAPREVSKHLAGYALHLAATNIVFLVESYRAMV